MELLIKILATGGMLGILDFLWLRLAARKLYESEMPHMVLDKPNIVPAALFYIIYVIGVLHFVVTPALEKNSWTVALINGALFGLVAYGTYGLTNLAAFKGFTAKAVAIDIVWGVFLTAAAGIGAYAITKLFI